VIFEKAKEMGDHNRRKNEAVPARKFKKELVRGFGVCPYRGTRLSGMIRDHIIDMAS
jgi:hypothetical protein